VDGRDRYRRVGSDIDEEDRHHKRRHGALYKLLRRFSETGTYRVIIIFMTIFALFSFDVTLAFLPPSVSLVWFVNEFEKVDGYVDVIVDVDEDVDEDEDVDVDVDVKVLVKHQQRTTNNQKPTTNNQQPTTNN
jgi:hypothetical protein